MTRSAPRAAPWPSTRPRSRPLFAIVVGLLSSVLISGYAVRWARPYRPPMWEIVLLSMIVATLVAMVVTWFASGVCE